MPSGYSGTPLAKKLGLKSGQSYMLHNPPTYYYDLFDDFPNHVTRLKGVDGNSADFIHIFCTTEEELAKLVDVYKPALKPNGMLWISWPKGSSSIPTDLKRDPIRIYLLSIGLVDVKIAAVDDDWSGLKFVYRLKDRN